MHCGAYKQELPHARFGKQLPHREAVGEVGAARDGALLQVRDAVVVLGAAHVEAVPVDGDALRHLGPVGRQLVVHRHLRCGEACAHSQAVPARTLPHCLPTILLPF